MNLLKDQLERLLKVACQCGYRLLVSFGQSQNNPVRAAAAEQLVKLKPSADGSKS